MATKDKPTGLLSKMVQLMRPAAKDSAEQDDSDFRESSEFAKQALKEQIARKRSDDAIRRREFDYLRKLRSSGPLVGSFVGSRPSDFNQAAERKLEQRANTIEKIDAIEAHMSMNWLDRKPAGPVAPRPMPTFTRPTPASATPPAPAPAPASLARPDASVATGNLLPMDDDDLDFTKGNIPPPTNNAILNAPTQKMELEGVKELPVDSGVSGFTNSKLVSIEMVDSLGDSDLQDAAMRFAEGDDVGAEAVLLSIVQAEEKFPGSADPCAAALFDMYRSLGNKQRFESAAMEYAQRFGRSPPEWYSPADLPPVQSGPVTETLPAVGRVSAPAWECPSLLDLDAVRRLRSILLTAEMPWHVSWGQLADVSAPAAPELEDLFRQWCVSAIQLRFDGAHVLERVLKSKTPSDDPQVDQIWWRVRLDALRILQLHDDFEEAALDFCLVYELSPPSWIPAQCQLHDRPTHQEVMDSGWGRMSNFMAELAPPVLLALSGELVGDCSDTLAAVLKLPKDPSERVVVSCARLVRVDFTSAGAILNWATECESIGSRVQFTDVPRLVAAFFGVIGINEYAKLGLRSK